VLLPQNEDPRISEVTISGDMATVLFLLDEREKSLELLKQNNAGGIFSGEIGSLLVVSDNDPAEAETFLSEALTAGMSNLLTAILGYVFVYRSRKEWRSAIDILNLGLDILTGLKRGDTPDVLAKTHAEMLVMLAYVQKEAGMPAESRDALKKARDLSRRFDSRPDYSLTNMRFADHTEQSVAFDILGASAALIVGIAELALFDQPQEGIHDIARQLGAGDFADDRNHLVEVHALAVRTVGIHRIKRIRDRDDLVLVELVDGLHLLIGLADRIDDLGEIESDLLSVSLDDICGDHNT
jgi:hypothetical protein